MRNKIIQEYTAAMDGIHFSAEAKDAMAKTLAAQARKQKARKTRYSSRKLALIAVAAAMVLVTLTGAAVFTRWSRSAQAAYNPSEDVKAQAEKSGLSVMLENSNSNEVLSVTDQGITVTAVQTIVDRYGAELTFRIEGFQLPEGRNPFTWPVITIDGSQNFYVSQTGKFFDGTTFNDAGEWVYVSDGTPVASDESGTAILDYIAEDGSLEYTHYISFHDETGAYFGKEIVVSFDSFGIQSNEKAGYPETLVEGNWEFRWILNGSQDSVTITPNTQIGDSGVTLLEAEIGQMTLRTVYQLESYWEGWETLENFQPTLYGVRMKDGTKYTCYASSQGYQDVDKLVYFVESSMFDSILDLSQVDALLFLKSWPEGMERSDLTEENFYIIPIH